MLFDTDVLTWALRGNAKAAKVIDATSGFELSAVSYMKLRKVHIPKTTGKHGLCGYVYPSSGNQPKTKGGHRARLG
jgi:hypothetical protein